MYHGGQSFIEIGEDLMEIWCSVILGFCDIENFDIRKWWDLRIDKLRGEAIYTSILFALPILSYLALYSLSLIHI